MDRLGRRVGGVLNLGGSCGTVLVNTNGLNGTITVRVGFRGLNFRLVTYFSGGRRGINSGLGKVAIGGRDRLSSFYGGGRVSATFLYVPHIYIRGILSGLCSRKVGGC